MLAYGYTFPPCIHIGTQICDPEALQKYLTWKLHGYYGHFPAMILGMNLYYRLVPTLVFVGLWVLLRRYGMLTVFLAWVMLFFVGRVIAFDLRNGTFVGVINFYLWGLVLLRSMSNWITGKYNGLIPCFLASLMVFFHAFTGIALFSGVILYGIIFRKPPILYASFLLGVAVMASYFLLPSSIGRIDVLPDITSGPIGKMVEYTTMDVGRFVGEYVGAGLWLYFGLAGIIATFAWTKERNFPKDHALMLLVVLCIPLLVMTFSPIALNADRTAKLLVGVCVILSTVIIVDGLQVINKKSLYAASGGVILLSLINEIPQLVPYWMNMGSWQ